MGKITYSSTGIYPYIHQRAVHTLGTTSRSLFGIHALAGGYAPIGVIVSVKWDGATGGDATSKCQLRIHHMPSPEAPTALENLLVQKSGKTEGGTEQPTLWSLADQPAGEWSGLFYLPDEAGVTGGVIPLCGYLWTQLGNSGVAYSNMDPDEIVEVTSFKFVC